MVREVRSLEDYTAIFNSLFPPLNSLRIFQDVSLIF